MSFIDWSYYKRDTLHLAFRLEIHPEAWPKDKFYACAPKYFTLELGLGYRVLWIWCNRDDQAVLHDKPNSEVRRVHPPVVQRVRRSGHNRSKRRSLQ